MFCIDSLLYWYHKGWLKYWDKSTNRITIDCWKRKENFRILCSLDETGILLNFYKWIHGHIFNVSSALVCLSSPMRIIYFSEIRLKDLKWKSLIRIDTSGLHLCMFGDYLSESTKMFIDWSSYSHERWPNDVIFYR